MLLRRSLSWIIALAISPGVLMAQAPASPTSATQADAQLSRIWAGVQQAQARLTTACGTMTETRTSSLMVKPLVLHGKFCATRTNQFMLEYLAPNPMHLQWNGDSLIITAANGKTQVLHLGKDVRKVQSSFSGKNSLDSLKQNFTITTSENSRDYEMKLVPRTQHMRHRLNELIVTLNKQNFLPRTLQVDGSNGVQSLFTLHLTSVNSQLPADTFEGIQTK